MTTSTITRAQKKAVTKLVKTELDLRKKGFFGIEFKKRRNNSLNETLAVRAFGANKKVFTEEVLNAREFKTISTAPINVLNWVEFKTAKIDFAQILITDITIIENVL